MIDKAFVEISPENDGLLGNNEFNNFSKQPKNEKKKNDQQL